MQSLGTNLKGVKEAISHMTATEIEPRKKSDGVQTGSIRWCKVLFLSRMT